MNLEHQDFPKSVLQGQEDSAVSATCGALERALDEASQVDLAWLRLPREGNAWTLGQDDLRFLVSLVRQLCPQHILEFGAGLSTRVLAKSCAETGRSCWITSVDHDPEFGRSAAEELARDNLNAIAQWGEAFVPGRRAIPFTERNGVYWGPPANDTAAVAELERLRRAGAGFIVFVWPAFWWLDYYRKFHEHLQENHRLVLQNDRLRIFDLVLRQT